MLSLYFLLGFQSDNSSKCFPTKILYTLLVPLKLVNIPSPWAPIFLYFNTTRWSVYITKFFLQNILNFPLASFFLGTILYCKTFVTQKIMKWLFSQPPAPSWRITPCWLLATVYTTFWHIPSIRGRSSPPFATWGHVVYWSHRNHVTRIHIARTNCINVITLHGGVFENWTFFINNGS